MDNRKIKRKNNFKSNKLLRRTNIKTIFIAIMLLLVPVMISESGEATPPDQHPDIEILTGFGNFTYHDDGDNADRPVNVYYYRPENYPGNDSKVIFCMHGSGRDAQSARDRIVPYADRYSALLVAPEFSRDYYPDADDYNRGFVKDGGGTGNLRARSDWTFLTIEEIFDIVLDEIPGAPTKYSVQGNSGAGQFICRLPWIVPESRIEVAAGSNSGWYTLPTRDELYPNGIGDLSITDEQLEQCFRKKIVTVVGELDTDPNSYSLKHNEFTDAQGNNRYERALFYHDYMWKHARKMGVPFNWDLKVVKDVGHPAVLMAHSTAGAVFTGATTPPSIELSPTDDTYIDESNENVNYGSDLELRIDGGNQEIAFLKFNLGSVTKPVAVALLKFYVTSGAPGKQYVHEVSDNSWTESDLKWNNAPALGDQIGMTSGGEKDGILYIEVTDYINEKIGGLASLAIQTEQTDSLRFNSSETSHFQPQLDLFNGSQPTDIRLSWIQDAANTTTTILWETVFSHNRCEVQYGITQDCELGNITGFNFHDSWYMNYSHQVTLTGLTPNTTYFYRVSGDFDNNWSSVKNFTTSTNTSINWTFFVTADSESLDDWASVVNAMKAFPEGRILSFAGDILENFNNYTDWCEWINASQELISNVSYISCKGDHDYNINWTGVLEYYNFSNSFAFPPNEQWFSYNYSNCHFIVLDTEESNNESQLAWLENDLQAAASDPDHPWIFVTFHKPVYGDGGHNSSIDARENFVPLLRDYGVDLVFSGHNHFYQRTYPLNLTDINDPTVSDWNKDIYYNPDPIFVTAGRASAQANTPTNENGWMVEDRMSMDGRYLKVDVYTNMSVHITARYLNNNVFDDFWIVKRANNGNQPPTITTSDITSATEEQLYYNDYEATDPENEVLTWNLITNASWLSIDTSTGELSGTPPIGSAGSYYVNVSVWDPNDGNDSHNFTLTVNVPNQPPTIITSDLTTAEEDQQYNNDYDASDPEGDTLTWSLNTDAGWLSIESATGILSGTPLNADVGSYWVNVTVSDGKGGLDWSNFTLTVTNTNDAPTIITSDVLTATEDQLYSVDYDADDIDPGPDVLTWHLNTIASFLGIDSGTGLLSGTPVNADVGSYWINVSVDDGNSGWDWSNFTLDVTNTNDPPTITTGDITTATEDVYYSNDYEGTDIDPTGDILTWSLHTNASWLTIESNTGILDGTPVNADVGSYWVNVSVDDGNSGWDWSNFTLDVTNTNDPPTITTGDITTATEEVYYSNDYDGTDIDPTGDTLTWSLHTNASWLAIDSNTGLLDGTPTNGDVGSYWVNVTLDDGNGGLDWTNFTLTVRNENNPPVITTSDVVTATEDQLYSVDYDADDIDPGPDVLTWHLNTNSSFLTINSGSGLLEGTPVNADVGSYWVNVSVDDGNSGWDWSNFTLDVTNTNDPPTITTGDITTATEGVYYSNDYDGTDIDPTGDTLTWSLHTNASWLAINSNTGLLDGTPTNGDYGTCWVNVTLDDGNGGLDWTNFTLTVRNENNPPVITTSDVVTATEDQLYSVDYDAEDIDPGPDVLTWYLNTNAIFLSINSGSGLLEGTPVNADVGSYWVNVSVDDGNSGWDWSNFTLDVTNTNDPPEITTGDITTATEEVYYSNDYDGTDIDPTGDTLTWSLHTNASWLAINSNTGLLDGTPTNGDVGSYWVNVTLDDGNGGLDWTNFTLTVRNENNPPVITTSDVVTATEDQLYSVDYDAEDIDPGPDVLTWYLNTNAIFLSINSGSGLLEGTPVNADVGSYWVNVSVDDGNSGWDWSNFTLDVTNTNDPPTITTGDITTATEEVYYSNDYDGTDIDPTGDTLTWSLHTNASWLTIDSNTGLLDGTPTNADYGTCWVNVTLVDGNGGLDWTNFTISVADANDAPTITIPNDTEADEDELYSVDYNATDIDLTNDVLTWSLDTNSSWLSINPSTGVLSGVPLNADVGSYWVNVTVSDGRGGLDWSNFTLTVTNTNDAPNIITSDVITATEDQLYSVDYDADDIDPGPDILTWYLNTNASFLNMNSGSGLLSGTPVNADVGSYWVNVSVDDGNSGWDWSNFTFSVTNTNDPPVITTGDITTATEEVYYSNDYDANDIDPPGDTLTWSLHTNASWLTINPGTGLLSGTPQNSDVGSFWVNVTVSDAQGGSDSHNFTLSVSDANDPPTITTSDVDTATEDSLYSVDYEANDIDPTSDTLSWSLITDADWLSIEAATGVLSGGPLNEDVGTYWVNVTVSDGRGGLDWSNFTVTVTNTNDAPIITTSDVTLAWEDSFYSIDYNATDVDPTGDILMWSCFSNAFWLGFNTINGFLIGTPTNAEVGTYWVNITVRDDKGGLSWTNFSLQVFNTNDEPTITTGDTSSATEDSPYNVDYDATDIDPVGDTLTWSLKTDASWLNINPTTGVLWGTPLNAHVGTYWVNVTVGDGKGGFDWTNFTITVSNINDDPIITTTDIITAFQDELYTNTYTAIDVDPTNDILNWSWSSDVTWLSFNSVTGVLKGTPTNADVGSYWVNITVTDGNGGLDFHNFTVTVVYLNKDPVITTTDILTVNEDEDYSVNYQATDIDSPLANQIWSLSTNATWLTIDPGTGVLSGTPRNSDVGSYWVIVKVIDGDGGFTENEFTLRVVNTNDAPEITTADVTTATEDETFSVDYDAEDIDPTPDELAWSLNTDAAFLSINSATGVLSGTPDNDDVGSYWVNVIVSDGNGGLTSTNFTLTVENVNDKPTIFGTDIVTAVEDTRYYVDYDADDIDPTDDTLVWTLNTNADWLKLDPDTGKLNGIPDNDDVGSYWVNVTVSDGKGGFASRIFTLTVSDINDAPVITTKNVMTTLEDMFYSVDYDATDVDSPLADQLWTLTTDAKWLSIDSKTGLLSGTPSNDDVGTCWVKVTVFDGEGGQHYINFTILVLNGNDDPTITNSDKTTADEGVEYLVDYEAVDIDPTDDVLTWMLNTNASFLKIDTTRGILYGTPEASDAGSYWVEVIVFDDNGGSDHHKFTIIVTPKPVPPEDPIEPTNNAPVITNTADAPTTAVTYTNLVFQFTASDPDSDVVSWSIISGPAWLSISSNSGMIFGTPLLLDTGPNQVIIQVSDGKGGIENYEFNITVMAPSENGESEDNGDQDSGSDNGFMDSIFGIPWYIFITLILIIVMIIVAFALARKRKKKELEKKKGRVIKQPCKKELELKIKRGRVIKQPRKMYPGR